MSFTKESWHDFSKKCTIKIGASTYHELFPSSMKISPVPYTGDGVVSETDINGNRVSTFVTKAFHLDVELSWDEVGPQNYPAVCTIIDALITNVGTATGIQFSPYDSTNTTDRDASLYSVIPEISSDMIEMIHNNRLRQRSVKIMLKAKETVSSIPGWMKF